MQLRLCVRRAGLHFGRLPTLRQHPGLVGPGLAARVTKPAPPANLGAPGSPPERYLSIFRAAEVHVSVMSRMNFACAVARLEIHSTSLEPGPRSIAPAIVLSAFS